VQIIKSKTHIDFMSKRLVALVVSLLIMLVATGSLVIRNLNFGIDFTGGTLVEVAYKEAAEIEDVRKTLRQGGFDDAVVQYFGTAREIMVRLPVSKDKKSAALSNDVMVALRTPFGERLAEKNEQDIQLCITRSDAREPCQVQMRRVEFVGPQVGDELTEKGGLAMLYALIGILIYVAFRFEWRFAVGAIAALVHDVLITIGFFSVLQLEFSLTVLAAILAVIGYSLNDTIVVFDRVRENFRKLRKRSNVEIFNISVNEMLPRTLLTSLTTLLVLTALFLLGGEIISGFALALIVGVFVGTYSSIFIASPVVLMLGLSREDMLPVKKEGAEADNLP
jgi:preprotein translocase subunit SecF